MQDKQIIGKVVSGISTPMSLLLLLFFFLPWLNLTCSGQEFGKASGFQLARGEMTQGEFAKNPGGMIGATSAPAQADEEDDEKKLNETIRARPWCYLGLIIPVILLAVGLSGLKGGGKSGAWLMVLGAVGLIVMIMAANVEYADDFLEQGKKEQAAKTDDPSAITPADAMQQMQQQMEEQMKTAFKTRSTGILWGSLVLYILVILCGLVNVLVSMTVLRVDAATPVGPAPPDQG